VTPAGEKVMAAGALRPALAVNHCWLVKNGTTLAHE